MDVHEEVVDEGVHGGQGADCLGGQLGRMGRLKLGQGMSGARGRLGRRLSRVRVGLAQAPLLDGLRMSIGRSSSPAGALKGARDLEGQAGATWRAGLVALHFAYAARVAGLAQAVGLGVVRGRGRLLGLGQMGTRVGQGMVGVEGLLGLQHLVDVFELGERGLGGVGHARRLAVEHLRGGIGVYGRVVRVLVVRRRRVVRRVRRRGHCQRGPRAADDFPRRR